MWNVYTALGDLVFSGSHKDCNDYVNERPEEYLYIKIGS